MKRNLVKATVLFIYVTSILFMLINTAYADNSTVPTLIGNYQCQRVDASNNTNAYALVISDNGGTSYSFEWDNAAGFPVLYGEGIMNPSMNNILSVTFKDPKDDNNFGVELFEIKSDGSLQSNWAVQSTSQVGSETCNKSS